jgi:hypothetical protein
MCFAHAFQIFGHAEILLWRKVWAKLAPCRSWRLKLRDYEEIFRLSGFALINHLRRRRRTQAPLPLLP